MRSVCPKTFCFRAIHSFGVNLSECTYWMPTEFILVNICLPINVMKMNRRVILSLCLSLALIVISTPLPSRAAISGNTYNFVTHWLEQSYHENDGPTVNSDVSGEFSIHVWNITRLGGDDLIVYRYQGWEFNLQPYYVDVNSSVAFQNNKVFWELSVTDFDNDSFAEDFNVLIYPYRIRHQPGTYLFVNPIWSTHDTDWNQAVADTQEESAVDQSTFTYSKSDGHFEFSFAINIEDTPNERNGTATYSFSADYDSDGILENLRFELRILLSATDDVLSYSNVFSVSRTNVIGVGPGLNLDAGVPVMYLAAIVPGSIILGLLIGKKVFG